MHNHSGSRIDGVAGATFARRLLILAGMTVALIAGDVLCTTQLAAKPPQPSAPAQPAQPADTLSVPTKPPASKQEPLPAPIRLGLRVAMQMRSTAVVPELVIVDSPAAYAAALSAWRRDALFPILIDDGSFNAKENIGRFVRAFAPKRVVRMAVPTNFVWPADAKAQGAAMQRIVADAQLKTGIAANAGPDAIKDLLARTSDPLGVVLANPKDTAWPAAVAVAAARGQVLLISDQPPPVDAMGAMTFAQAKALSDQITSQLSAANITYAGTDDIDSLTLCMNTGVRVNMDQAATTAMRVGIPGAPPAKPGEAAATSDVLGRFLSGTNIGKRWAWGGQLMGSESTSAYRAMCAIFLKPTSAWISDGYEDKAPFSNFSGAKAAEVLKSAGFTTSVNTPRQRSLDGWQSRAARPVDAGLILMNSSGMPFFFDLANGERGEAVDVPMLSIPAVAHVVHSWSATNPEHPGTIGGRWLDHGCYAYVGSVQEPYLSAFVPTPLLANRLVLGAPLGAAARIDDAPVWRVAVLGDPLVMSSAVNSAVARGISEKPLPVTGPVVADQLKNALALKDFAAAIGSLATLGRDADVCKLTDALLRESPDQLTPAAACAAIPSAHRRGETELLVKLFKAGRAELATGPHSAFKEALKDTLWHTMLPRRSSLTDDEVTLLKQFIRSDTFVRDVSDVAASLASRRGKAAAEDYLASAAASAPNAAIKEKILELVKRKPK